METLLDCLHPSSVPCAHKDVKRDDGVLRERTGTTRYDSNVINDHGDDMVGPSDNDRDRARPVQVPRWWLEEAVRRVEAWKVAGEGGQPRGLIELGEVLAAHIGRDEKWSHTTLSLFLRAKSMSDELVNAVTLYFNLPRHLYYPKSLQEAIALHAAGNPLPSAERVQSKRLWVADGVAAGLEGTPSAGARQGGNVKKTGERTESGEPGRPRRVGTNRKATRRT